MDMAGIAPMGWGQGAAQAVGIRRNQDEVRMIGHRTPGPYRDTGRRTVGGKAVTIKGMVLIIEEGALAPIAALRDV
ncbi:hypothetical protein, partial [Citrobacter koseri]|uniref:hypothetical protein n=1 Tax=Citrobacter koseri TaxID=545 RepID=UPI001EF987D7